MDEKTNPLNDGHARCENCVFYGTNSKTGSKVCVRHPPVAQLVDVGSTIELYSFWPQVAKDAICGEYMDESAFRRETP